MSNPDQANNQQSDSASEPQFDIAESTYKTSHAAVRKARRFAMQGLYEWLMTDHRFEQSGQKEWKENAPHDIAARTRASNAMHTVHLGYYHDMMRDIPAQLDELEALISEHLDRDINLLDPIEHAILLIGTYELKDRLEVPYKVVLDEAMKLNTHFGATDAHKLINAVLDKLAPVLRELEVNADESLPKIASNKAPKKATLEQDGNETADNESDVDTANNDKVANIDTDATENPMAVSASQPEQDAKPRIGRHADNKGVRVKRNRNLAEVSRKNLENSLEDNSEKKKSPLAAEDVIPSDKVAANKVAIEDSVTANTVDDTVTVDVANVATANVATANTDTANTDTANVDANKRDVILDTVDTADSMVDDSKAIDDTEGLDKDKPTDD